MPNIKFECEKCGSLYKEYYTADKCEKDHGHIRILIPDEIFILTDSGGGYTYKRTDNTTRTMSAGWKANYDKGDSLPRNIIYTDDDGSRVFYRLVGDEE